jgi:hypothetical protein
LAWSSSPGHNYRILSSTNAITWTPLSGWLRASSNQLSYSVPLNASSGPLFFRLETSP